MLERALFLTAFGATIGAGLVAGVFFAFSSFIMAAFARVPAEIGLTSMNMINVTVITPSFMLALFGTGLLCLILVVGGYAVWGGADGLLLMAASAIYLIGALGVTMAFNVPLNDALAAMRPDMPQAAGLWARFLQEWTMWNHVRTVASLVSAIMFMAFFVRRAVA
jgi:uncharacterized membrane protein